MTYACLSQNERSTEQMFKLSPQKRLYKINTEIQQKQRLMQNQLQYPASYNPQQPSPPNPNIKYNSPTHLKSFDKTLPAPTIKHYSSNPNLSLDFNNLKHPTSNPSTDSPTPPTKKASQFRSPPSHSQYAYTPTPSSHRPPRAEMTKSLIIGDLPNVDVPEQNTNTRKDIFKNPTRKQYRMSETIDDIPQNPYSLKRQEFGINSPKESNFLKKDSFDQKSQAARQVPSFLNRDRGLDMKRSQVIEPTFETNRIQLRDLKASHDLGLSRQLLRPKPKSRKVTVDDFTRLKQLGNGKYGRVYLVREKYSGFICALKVIEKKLLHEEQITDQFIRQVKIQMFLNHPNIIKMYGCFDDAVNIYIILEVGTGGQLYHQLKKSQPLSEPRIAFIMRQVCEAVNQIHSLRIIHRDIKPQNIVLHDNIIKLCDFGWSVHQDNKLRTTFCGTPLYVCPEILKGKEYDQKIDIWSIGIMMYEMVVGENPFKITREEELIKIVKDQIKIPAYLFVSAEVRDFLDRCLQKNPNDRANIKELVNHQFFKKHQEKEKSKVLNL